MKYDRSKLLEVADAPPLRAKISAKSVEAALQDAFGEDEVGSKYITPAIDAQKKIGLVEGRSIDSLSIPFYKQSLADLLFEFNAQPIIPPLPKSTATPEQIRQNMRRPDNKVKMAPRARASIATDTISTGEDEDVLSAKIDLLKKQSISKWSAYAKKDPGAFAVLINKAVGDKILATESYNRWAKLAGIKETKRR